MIEGASERERLIRMGLMSPFDPAAVPEPPHGVRRKRAMPHAVGPRATKQARPSAASRRHAPVLSHRMTPSGGKDRQSGPVLSSQRHAPVLSHRTTPSGGKDRHESGPSHTTQDDLEKAQWQHLAERSGDLSTADAIAIQQALTRDARPRRRVNPSRHASTPSSPPSSGAATTPIGTPASMAPSSLDRYGDADTSSDSDTGDLYRDSTDDEGDDASVSSDAAERGDTATTPATSKASGKDDGDEGSYQRRLETWCLARRHASAKAIPMDAYAHLPEVLPLCPEISTKGKGARGQGAVVDGDQGDMLRLQPREEDHAIARGFVLPRAIHAHLFPYQRTGTPPTKTCPHENEGTNYTTRSPSPPPTTIL